MTDKAGEGSRVDESSSTNSPLATTAGEALPVQDQSPTPYSEFVVATATPLPWHVLSSPGRNAVMFEDPNYGPLGVAEMWGGWNRDAAANARFVALACNSYPLFVQLLQSIAADKSAYQWHTAIANTLKLAEQP